MENIIKTLEEKGSIEVQPGVYLSTGENMAADQEAWDETDGTKHVDFSDSPFWITTDNGSDPEGFDSLDEVLKSLGIEKIALCPICNKGFAPINSLQVYDTLRCKRIAGDRRRYEARKVKRRAYQAARKRQKKTEPQNIPTKEAGDGKNRIFR